MTMTPFNRLCFLMEISKPINEAGEEIVSALTAIRDALKAGHDVSRSPVTLDDPRIDYVEIQVSRADWEQFCAADRLVFGEE
jgi:hypothetical protein